MNGGTIAGGVGSYGGSAKGGGDGAAVQFGTLAGTIVLDRHAVFTGAISGFTAGDVLDSVTKVTTLTFMAGTLTLEHAHAPPEALTLAGTFTAADFHLMSDGHGGTDITYGSHAPDFAPITPHDPGLGAPPPSYEARAPVTGFGAEPHFLFR